MQGISSQAGLGVIAYMGMQQPAGRPASGNCLQNQYCSVMMFVHLTCNSIKIVTTETAGRPEGFNIG